MRRRRTNNNKPREKRTLIPSFDPEELAKEIEDEVNRQTITPPFDPASYARIVEQRVVGAPSKVREAAPTLPECEAPEGVPPPGAPAESHGLSAGAPRPFVGSPIDSQARVGWQLDPQVEDTIDTEDAETIGREMYGCYLASNFPEALVLAERLLATAPEHALAQLVAERCRERLLPSARALNPSSVLRLKFAELERQAMHIDPRSSLVLGLVDGVSDAETVAALTGLPKAEALDRLHALIDLGVLEVVNG